jgi:hypothetical protein
VVSSRNRAIHRELRARQTLLVQPHRDSHTAADTIHQDLVVNFFIILFTKMEKIPTRGYRLHASLVSVRYRHGTTVGLARPTT